MEEEDRYTRITLRLPKDLHARLDQAADRTSKSLNAEIVGRLEESFRADSLAMNEVMLFEMRRTQLLLELHSIKSALDQLSARSAVLHRVIYDSSDTPTLAAAEEQLQQVISDREPLEQKEAIALARLDELDALKKPHR